MSSTHRETRTTASSGDGGVGDSAVQQQHPGWRQAGRDRHFGDHVDELLLLEVAESRVAVGHGEAGLDAYVGHEPGYRRACRGDGG